MADLALEYAELLKQLALLRHELYTLGQRFSAIGRELQSEPEKAAFGGPYPEAGAILEKIQRLRELLTDRRRIEGTMKDAGLGALIRTEKYGPPIV